jgi:ATPase family associated with various cellular activities (AAA)
MSKNPVNTISTTADAIPHLLERAYARRTSLFLWGKPGIGKSTMIREWVRAKKDWDFHDVRLTTMEPSDLRGLPSIDQTNHRTIWNLPEFLPDSNYETPGVIFLDELTAADQRLQAAAYELVNERTIGGKPIPKNYWVVAAGNTVEDGAISFDMGTALADRFLHIYVIASASNWLKWAANNDVHPSVQTFIKIKPDELETNERAQKNKDLITPTPRSWQRVSDLLKQEFSADITGKLKRNITEIEVTGLLGTDTAQSFFHVLEEVAGLPDIATLLAAEPKKQLEMVPDTIAALYGLTYSTVGYATDLKTLQLVMKLFDNLTKAEKVTTPREEIRSLAFEMVFARASKLGLMRELVRTKEYAPYAKKAAEMAY